MNHFCKIKKQKAAIKATDWNPPSLWLFTVKWIKALTAGNKISFLNQILAVFSGSYVVVLGIYYKLQTFLYLLYSIRDIDGNVY